MVVWLTKVEPAIETTNLAWLAVSGLNLSSVYACANIVVVVPKPNSPMIRSRIPSSDSPAPFR